MSRTIVISSELSIVINSDAVWLSADTGKRKGLLNLLTLAGETISASAIRTAAENLRASPEPLPTPRPIKARGLPARNEYDQLWDYVEVLERELAALRAPAGKRNAVIEELRVPVATLDRIARDCEYGSRIWKEVDAVLRDYRLSARSGARGRWPVRE